MKKILKGVLALMPLIILYVIDITILSKGTNVSLMFNIRAFNFSVLNILTMGMMSAYVIIVVYIYGQYDKDKKELKRMKSKLSLSDITYGPDVCEYIVKSRLSSNGFSALTLDLIRKKVFHIEKEGSKYFLVKNEYNEDKLNNRERFFIDWLMADFVKKDNRIDFTVFKDITKSSKKLYEFANRLSNFNDRLIVESKALEIFEDLFFFKIEMSLFIFLGYFLAMLNILLNNFSIMTTIFSLVSPIIAVYVLELEKYTYKGEEQVQKLSNYNNLLKKVDCSSNNKLTPYIVYGYALGHREQINNIVYNKAKEHRDNSLYNDMIGIFSEDILGNIDYVIQKSKKVKSLDKTYVRAVLKEKE